MNKSKMTLLQHFAEFRRRLVWILIIFAVAFGLGWFAAPFIQEFLIEPLISVWPNGSMIYIGLTDGLMIQFYLATLFAIFITIPFILWHIWAFVAPGLHKNEKHFIAPILVLSPVLFLIGAAFAFYILFPVVFKFFINLNQSSPVPTAFLPNTKDYLTFSIGLLKIFGIAFQLPLFMVLLNRVGILSKRTALKSRRYAIVIIFIIAAVLTPPDVVSQCMLAIPLIALFELALLFMKKEPKLENKVV
ncbi:MAG: twin-arginine translocase subunit TatC [Alphaproteobacteria bacterium]|jgi:sec-independent protein translocase protein TatC